MQNVQSSAAPTPKRPPLPAPTAGRSSIWITLLISLLMAALGLAVGFLVVKLESPLYLTLAIISLLAALIILARPEVGLFTLVFISYTRLSDVLISEFGAPSIAKPMVALLAGVLLVRWVILGETPTGWLKPFLLLAANGLVIFISLFHSSEYSRAYYELSNFLQDAFVCLLIVVLLQRGRFLRLTVWALLSAGLMMSVITTYQYITGTFTNNYFGFGLAPYANISGGTSDYRIAGPIGDPNFYAQMLVALIPMAIDRMFRERQRILALLAGLTLTTMTLSVIFTFSRGGFIALAVTLVAVALYYRLPPSRFVVLALVVIAIIPFLPTTYQDRIKTLLNLSSEQTSTGDVSFRGRTSEYIVGLMMFADNPILGVGVGSYQVNYQQYSRQVGIDPRNEMRSPHSLYVQIAAEEGLFGLFVFGIILWSTFQSVFTARKTFLFMRENDRAGMAAALGIGLMGYLTASLFVHLGFQRPFWVLIGVTLALLELARQEIDEKERFQV